MSPLNDLEPKLPDLDDPEGDLWDNPGQSRDDLQARYEAELGDMKSKFEREDSAL